ncbi:MAG: acyl-CoA dehydrogenase family protein [Bradymonadaceae bacterium]
MYTDPSEDIQSIVDQVADFVDEELIPLETDWLADEFDDFEAVIEEKRELVREMNLWTPHLSEQWGGCGLSLQEFAMIAEQLGRSPFGHYVFNCQAPDAGNMEVLIEHGRGRTRPGWRRGPSATGTTTSSTGASGLPRGPTGPSLRS